MGGGGGGAGAGLVSMGGVDPVLLGEVDRVVWKVFI